MVVAVCIPGFAVQTLLEVDGILSTPLPDIQKLISATVFLTEPLPENTALAIYLTNNDGSTYYYWGMLANTTPSDTFWLQQTISPGEIFRIVAIIKVGEEIISFVNGATSVGFSCSQGCVKNQLSCTEAIIQNFIDYINSFKTNSMSQGDLIQNINFDVLARWQKNIYNRLAGTPHWFFKPKV